ncbi:DUF1565 domain-containing protein [Planctomycetota bacterium]
MRQPKGRWRIPAKTVIRPAPILCLVLCVVASGYAQDYFVAPSGRDTNDGSLKAPFRTVQRAVNNMTAGDVCHIRGGRYHESVRLEGLRGTVAAPVVIKAYTKLRWLRTQSPPTARRTPGWIPI